MGALEEFGWRGFAQPILQERYTAARAALLVGGVWTVWHYYLFFNAVPWTREIDFVLYAARLVAASLVYAWIYNGTGGSVLLVMIYYATGNLAPSSSRPRSSPRGSRSSPGDRRTSSWRS